MDLLIRIEDWLRRSTNQIVILLVTTYLAVLASMISYAHLSGGSGMPGQAELILLLVAMLVFCYLMIYSTRA
ncbi:MAG: hypothetical protein SVG88_08400 [Halobacteriales archaeon]|nr:hypothetical protein [Halobacteriales archaeon]